MTNENQELIASDKWLKALARTSVGQSQTAEENEAASVRRALIARRNSYEREAENFDHQRFEAFKAKLVEKKLIKSESKSLWGSLLDFTLGASSSSASGVGVAQKVGVVALILVIGLALKVSYFDPQNEDVMRLRGDANVTYIIDANVESKVNEIVNGLKEIKAEFTQEQESYGKVSLKIKSSDEVLTYLSGKRIEPKEIDGHITIVVTPPNLKSK